MNDYYVYIYWRLDINEPFYIGMGRDRRWKNLHKNQRNKYFNNIANKHQIVCEIIKDNLTEKQAFGIECWLINELVFEYGFSIDIKGNRSKEKGQHLVNCTWGGEGCSGRKHTEEWKQRQSEIMRGENNPMYGVHMKGENNYMYGKHLSEETKEKIRKKAIGRKSTKETKKKLSEIRKELFKGEKNPMYGKKGKDNKNSKPVICLTTKKIFYSTKEAGEYYNIKATSSIGQCCNKKLKSTGKLSDGTKLVWKWLIWKHNKKYRIKNNNK